MSDGRMTAAGATILMNANAIAIPQHFSNGYIPIGQPYIMFPSYPMSPHFPQVPVVPQFHGASLFPQIPQVRKR